MSLKITQLFLFLLLCFAKTDCFRWNPVRHRSVVAKSYKENQYKVLLQRSNMHLSDTIDESVVDGPKHENLIGSFTKRFLCLALCPINKVSKHVEAWPNHMNWLRIASRYKTTRVAVVQAEHLMLSEDRTRPHAHLMFVDSNNALDVMMYGLVDEPFAVSGGVKDWMHFDTETIIPWKPTEVLDTIFEHQAFVGRICNNRTSDESDRMLALSAEYYKTHPDQILYAARLYPAVYGSMTMEEAMLLNLHRPVGELVMLRTNNRSEALSYLQGNPLLETFTGHTSQFDSASKNPLNMTYWIGSTRKVPVPEDIPYQKQVA